MIQEENVITTDELRRAAIIKEIRRLKNLKKIKIVFLTIAGVISLLSLYFSYYMFFGYMDSFPTFEKPQYEYYGGDAYTGMQNATVDAANNIAEMGDILKNYIYDFAFGMGALFLIIGVLLLLFVIYMLCKTISAAVVVDKSQIDSIVETEMIYKMQI